MSDDVAAERDRGERPDQPDLQALLEALPEPVVVHERGKILAVNRAFRELLAFDHADELIGRFALEFVHPDDRDFVLARLESTMKNRRTPEHRLVDRTGTVIPVEVTGVPFPIGGTVAALAVVHDLRERKRVAAELAAAEQLASLGRLASAVGHEINNPLTYLLGALDLLARDIPDLAKGNAEAMRMLARLDAVRDGAARVRDIVRDLKTLSKPAETPIGPVDLHRVLELAIATAMHEIGHRARLVRDFGETVPVAASEGRLVQVFVNLLVNAAHAIPDGDASLNEIRVATRMLDAESVSVAVSDTGRGIAPSDAGRLFEPFFTTKHGTGMGLGLSIVHRIVTSFGGTVVVEPNAPHGSSFRVTLPASSGAVVRDVAASSPAPAGRRGRVLFADDEPMIRDLAHDALAPHDVVTVASGRAAIELLRREHFDAIVCDLQMPDLGGVDVYEWIVASRPELADRIVFMSGGAFTERAHRFIASAPVRHVEKPLDLERMRDLVDRMITAC